MLQLIYHAPYEQFVIHVYILYRFKIVPKSMVSVCSSRYRTPCIVLANLNRKRKTFSFIIFSNNNLKTNSIHLMNHVESPRLYYRTFSPWYTKQAAREQKGAYLFESPHPLHKLLTITSCFLWKEELPLKSGSPSASHRCTCNRRNVQYQFTSHSAEIDRQKLQWLHEGM